MSEAQKIDISFLNQHPAGFWIRFGAISIDTIFTLLIMGMAGLLTNHGYDGLTYMLDHTDRGTFLKLLYIIIYYVIPESSAKYQGSLGKYLVGIKIVNNSGNKLSFARALARNFAKILSWLILFIGFAIAGIRKDKKALHDIICGTRVVYADK